MSMTANYVALASEELEELMSGKKTFDSILEEQGRMAMVRGSNNDQKELAIRRYAQADFLNRKHIADKAGLSEEDMVREIKQRGLHIWFDLDKIWNEMHILLTGEELPLRQANALVTGDLFSIAVMAEDNFPGNYGSYGYGPPRYIRPLKVKEIATALGKLDFAELNAKHEAVDEGDDWMEETFDDFKLFYSRASLNNEAVGLLYL